MKSPMINNRALVLVLLLAIMAMAWLGATLSAQAQGSKLPKRSGHINDFGDVLDRTTKEQLETVLKNLQEKAGLDFAVATIRTTGNEKLYDYSLRVANSWNVGVQS